MTDAELDERVLWELPLDAPDTTWLLASEVADRLDVDVEAATAALERLAARSLAVHDAGWPRRWARPAEGAPYPARLAA